VALIPLIRRPASPLIAVGPLKICQLSLLTTRGSQLARG